MLREIFKPGMRLISRFVCACGLCARECVSGGARVRYETPEALRNRVTGIEAVNLAVKIHSNVQHPFPMFPVGPTQPPIQWVPGLCRR